MQINSPAWANKNELKWEKVDFTHFREKRHLLEFEVMKISSSARRCVFSQKWVKLTQDELFSIFKSKYYFRVKKKWIHDTRNRKNILKSQNRIFSWSQYISYTELRQVKKKWIFTNFWCMPEKSVLFVQLLFLAHKVIFPTFKIYPNFV